jgi:putative aminopeptidase FrvX
MKNILRVVLLAVLFVSTLEAQKVPGSLRDDLRDLVQTPAIPGYEQELAAKITARLKAYSPKSDNVGNVIVTIGSGAPSRLLVAPMDEPGYVISGITDDGYLRVQRLPQNGALPLFNELQSAQPVKIGTGTGKWIWGSVGGLSIHLQPGRQHPPSAADLDNVFIDIGATSSKEARATGADLLSPMAVDRTFYEMGNGQWASPAIGDRFGDAALLEVLRQLDQGKLRGTLTVAFVAQQWADSRGLNRMLQAVKPDELIYVGRLVRASRPAASADTSPLPAFTQKPGSGVLAASTNSQDALSGMAAELKQLAGQSNIPFASDFSARITPATARGSLPNPPLPERTVHLSVATEWPSTPAEFLDAHDVANLAALLETYLQGQAAKIEIPAAAPLPAPALAAKPSAAPANEAILKQLSQAYGVSGGHEGAVREVITRLLPSWAKTETDSSGNLILRWGKSQTPSVLVVAHQDEIGYEIRSILPDGRLDLEQKGGGVLAYFMGHPLLVHSGNGMHPGVLELPEGWDKSDFQWPRGPRTSFRMDVGASTPEQVAQLGIKTGDYVTIPKQYRKLAGTRASARAFDDRVGCAALVSAVWALGPDLGNRNITFVWSTAEELGLLGAADVAKRMGAEGHAPEYVFAVDTFVSADSPIESKRFGDAYVGQGFVVRAVDNSNIVPHPLVDKVIAMAREQRIPVQYGVTGGGNDGSAFLQYGSTDVALGWPLRYSHSPGEVIDTRDLDALARIITQVARKW